MKTNIILISGIVLCLLLSACGSEEPKQIGGQVQNITTGTSVAGSSNDAATTNMNPQVEEIGYAFSIGNIDVVVDADVSDIVSKLGDADSYYEAPSCAFNGIEKIYSYSGFDICTYEDGDTDRIASVILKNDLVNTKEGICIGDDVSAVETAYGEPTAKADNSILYVKNGGSLLFIIVDDRIVQIEYNTLVKQ